MDDIAERTGAHPETVRGWLRSGVLKGEQGRTKRDGWRVSPEALETFMKSREGTRRTARIIAFSNQKGGVGKTTTTANLGYALVERGKRVLVVDCDAQANLSLGLGVADTTPQRSIAAILGSPGRKLSEVIVHTQTVGLDIVPSHLELAEVDQMLTAKFGGHNTLRNALTPELLSHYDYVLLDSPPNFGQLTFNVLCSASEVVVPVATHFYALQGLTALLNRVEEVKREANPKLRILGLLATRFDPRVLLCKEVAATLPRHGPTFRTVIHEASKAAEAPSWGRTVLQHDSHSQSAEQHRQLAAEIEFGVGVFEPETGIAVTL
ncbi:MAG: AAA family ATPase [Pleurocapsa sp. SU_196_0]|nr:AAA family ATPase [Pleurocapsa sp. SU_196_0]